MSHSFFVRNPEAFYEFYKEKMMFLEAEPNPAHEKLAQLEHVGKLTAVITQNIDGLHQKAGSEQVLEPVSYTHLDVYKRQHRRGIERHCA